MQETGVGWDPMYEGRLPWFTKVFVLYLVLALFVSVFRVISIMRRLGWPEKKQQEADGRFQLTREFCKAKTASIKRLAMLTFLLSLLSVCLEHD
jgi:hypothetical protein